MRSLCKFAAALVMGISCGAWAGVTPAPVDVPAVSVGADADATFASASRQFDGGEFLVDASSTAPTTYAAVSDNSSRPVKQSAGPTVVPLPAAAPAGLMLLGMIGLVGLFRRLRSRLTAPI